MIAVVSSKGQIVIPAALRRRLGLGPGAKVELTDERDSIRLRVVRPLPEAQIAALAGMITARSSQAPRSLDDFDAASLADVSS